MDEYKPNYYPHFKCIGGKCKHSYCKLWDIEIDIETALYYKGDEPKIYKSVIEEKYQYFTYYYFRRDKNRNCVHLQKDGFCTLQCKYGEDILPENCKNHPRFYNYQGDRMEYGLGICCEEACRIILDAEKPFALFLKTVRDYHDDEFAEKDTLDDDDEEFLQWVDGMKRAREVRDDFIAIFNDSELSFSEAFSNSGASLVDAAECYEVLAPLERLDKSWTRNLEYLKVKAEDVDVSQYDKIFRNLAIYFLYRYTETLGNGKLNDWLHFMEFSVSAIINIAKGIKKQTGKLEKRTLLEICREYSAEIEYSTENGRAIAEGLVY